MENLSNFDHVSSVTEDYNVVLSAPKPDITLSTWPSLGYKQTNCVDFLVFIVCLTVLILKGALNYLAYLLGEFSCLTKPRLLPWRWLCLIVQSDMTFLYCRSSIQMRESQYLY